MTIHRESTKEKHYLCSYIYKYLTVKDRYTFSAFQNNNNSAILIKERNGNFLYLCNNFNKCQNDNHGLTFRTSKTLTYFSALLPVSCPDLPFRCPASLSPDWVPGRRLQPVQYSRVSGQTLAVHQRTPALQTDIYFHITSTMAQ